MSVKFKINRNPKMYRICVHEVTMDFIFRFARLFYSLFVTMIMLHIGRMIGMNGCELSRKMKIIYTTDARLLRNVDNKY